MATLYISDLDGTLLTDRAALSTYSRDTLQGLLHEGLPFTVASARSGASMRMMLRGLDLSLPVVEFNGAFLSDLETGRHELVHALDPPIAEDAYRLTLDAGHAPFVSTYDGDDDLLYYRDVVNDGMRWYLEDRRRNDDPRLRAAADLARALRDQVVCLTVIGKPGPLSELQGAIEERHAGRVQTYLFANDYSPGWHWLTIHDRRATKDRAIRALSERYGLQDRELVVFGDGLNDLGMFGAADRAVAVANACAELKERATELIGANEEDSVARYIRADWGGPA